jgi:hypothetical protein
MRPLTVRPTVAPKTKNVWPVAVAPVKWPRLKNAVFFSKAIPDEHVVVQEDVKTEKGEQSVIITEPVVGRFSNQYHCQRRYRKVTITWMAANALELYRRLLPVVTVDCWSLPIVFQRTIQPTNTTTTVAAAAMIDLKAPLAITWKPLAIEWKPLVIPNKDEDQVDDKMEMEKAVTAYKVNGWFSHLNQFQRSCRKLKITWMTAGTLKLYIRLSPAVTVDCWPFPIVFQRTIQPTNTATTIAAAATNILKAPLAIEWKTLAILTSLAVTASLAKTTATLTITTGSMAITAAPSVNPNRRLCNRPNCKNRRCRRRKIAATKGAPTTVNTAFFFH